MLSQRNHTNERESQSSRTKLFSDEKQNISITKLKMEMVFCFGLRKDLMVLFTAPWTGYCTFAIAVAPLAVNVLSFKFKTCKTTYRIKILKEIDNKHLQKP